MTIEEMAAKEARLAVTLSPPIEIEYEGTPEQRVSLALLRFWAMGFGAGERAERLRAAVRLEQAEETR